MSYLVLARKSRPTCFSEVVGQKPVVRTLQNALSQNRVAHAMIFSGVRGVGKTTLARIMAKALNCEQRESQPEPCCECRSCQEIHNGSSVDLVEIDGASNRGIQEIRELKENIRFMPTGSRYKIIIIDEVHMLTTEAFNALLKTLEEPPEHVYFMFATTELHRVPVTILSRCQRYELKRVGTGELAEHFKAIATNEKVEIDQAALNIITREAAGSVRDGLSLLDQVFSYCGDTVSGDEVIDMLGLVSHEAISSIAAALLDSNIDEALGQLDSMYDYGLDLKRFINDLLSWFRALVICSVTKQPQSLLDFPDDVIAELKDTSGKHSSRVLILIFNSLMENLEKASFSSQSRFAVEMAFVKAVQAREVVPVTTLLARLDEMIDDAPEQPKKKPVVEQNEASSPVEQHPLKKETVITEQTQPAHVTEQENSLKGDDSACFSDEQEEVTLQNTVDDPDPSSLENESVPERKSGNGAGGKLLNKSVRKHWSEFIEYVRDRKPWMASALQLASGVNLEKDQLLLHYTDATECGLLKNRDNITPLTEFALDFFQENFRIRFILPDEKQCEIDPVNGKTPQQERQALAADALVLTAVDIFNGEVGDIRVGPRFRKPMEEKASTGSEGNDVIEDEHQ